MTINRRLWLVSLVGPALLFLLAIGETVSAITEPEQYPFGWEGGGWKYRTLWAYVAANAWTVLLSAACFVATVFAKRAAVLWSARVFSTIATIPFAATFVIEGLGLLGLPTEQSRAAIAADTWVPVLLFPFLGSMPG